MTSIRSTSAGFMFRKVTVSISVEPNGPRAHYLRARVEAGAAGWTCTPFARQDSSLLSVLAEANALMVRAPDDPARAMGETVEFIWL
jgi:molybdopterin molybdotransferase